MKQIYTKQRSANRHPKKYNFNRIETMPVAARREEDILGADWREYDANADAREAKKAYRASEEYLRK